MPPIIKTATAVDRVRPDRITPIPGAVWRDRHWTVKGVERGGSTNSARAFMEADHTDTAGGMYTRAHEMVHTVISPESVPKENAEAYIALEEVQVVQYMRNTLDLPEEAYDQHEQDKQDLFKRAKDKLGEMNRRQRALIAIACGDEGTPNDVRRIKELLDNKRDVDLLNGLIGQVRQMTPYMDFSPSEAKAQEVFAARFDLLFNDADEEDEEDEGEGTTSGAGEGEEEDDDEGEEAESEKAGVGGMGPKPKTPAKEKPKTDFERHKEAAEWYPMNIERPPLVHASKALKLLQKRRLSDTGSHITRLTRLASDGFIFGDKRRVQGGTVVVDTSGSMALATSDIQHLLDVAPAATVAIYAHDGGPFGVLRIIVDKGRMADEDKFSIGGGNGVDGPALDWLAKMPEPRFWVSDGYVVGKNGSGLDHLNYCRIVCKRGRIVRLNDVPTAIERLTGKKQTPAVKR